MCSKTCCESLKLCWSVKSNIDEAKENYDRHKESIDTVNSIHSRNKERKRGKTLAGKKRRSFKKAKNRNNCCPKLAAVYHDFVNTYSDAIVILTALISVAAFYNDFISDIQVLVFISNVPNYNWIALIMLLFMACQYFAAVYAIRSYLEVCEISHMENVFGSKWIKYLVVENKNNNDNNTSDDIPDEALSIRVRKVSCCGKILTLLIVPIIDMFMFIVEPLRIIKKRWDAFRGKNINEHDQNDEKQYWMLSDQTASFIVQYIAVRELTELFFETLPSLTLQLVMLNVQEIAQYTNDENDKIEIFGVVMSTLVYSLTSTIMHMIVLLLSAIIQASYLGLSPYEYVKSLFTMGFGTLPIQAIMDNKIDVLTLPNTIGINPLQLHILQRALKKNQSNDEPSIQTISYIFFHKSVDEK
jgi:hypothetical protein